MEFDRPSIHFVAGIIILATGVMLSAGLIFLPLWLEGPMQPPPPPKIVPPLDNNSRAIGPRENVDLRGCERIQLNSLIIIVCPGNVPIEVLSGVHGRVLARFDQKQAANYCHFYEKCVRGDSGELCGLPACRAVNFTCYLAGRNLIFFLDDHFELSISNKYDRIGHFYENCSFSSRGSSFDCADLRPLYDVMREKHPNCGA